jgi:NAD(P)-dependent dehydrogenase (short-subunit alcohol dehydrogenase family)
VQPADVCSPEQVVAMVEDTVATSGRLDILVNNAGVASVFPAEEMALEEWDRVLEINLRGLFLCCQAGGKQMLAQRSGRIINIASVIGFLGFPQRSAYGASKAGVINLTRVLACEWAAHGVTVNAVSPGYVRTPLLEEDVARGIYDVTDILQRTPSRRLVEVEDVANAVLFLASDAASSITGVNLPVDGGWQAYGYT